MCCALNIQKYTDVEAVYGILLSGPVGLDGSIYELPSAEKSILSLGFGWILKLHCFVSAVCFRLGFIETS